MIKNSVNKLIRIFAIRNINIKIQEKCKIFIKIQKFKCDLLKNLKKFKSAEFKIFFKTYNVFERETRQQNKIEPTPALFIFH